MSAFLVAQAYIAHSVGSGACRMRNIPLVLLISSLLPKPPYGVAPCALRATLAVRIVRLTRTGGAYNPAAR